MWIYLTLIITLIAAVTLKFVFDKEIKWKEVIICLLCTAFILLIGRCTALYFLPRDKEFLNGYITRAKYYEDWNELVVHTYVTSDGKGHTQVHTYTTIDYHPEEWRAETNCLGEITLNKQLYDKYVGMWKNQKFKDLKRSYHSNDGDLYYSDFTNNFNDLVPITKVHYYENKIRHSKNVFNYEKLNSEEATQVFNYPDLNLLFVSIDSFPYLLGVKDNNANHLLSSWNAKLGAARKVTIFLLIYFNKSQDVSFFQERHWQGGNKNELVVCVGVDQKNNISWARVFSWSDSETLKSTISSSIIKEKKFDLIKTINIVGESTEKMWFKKDFKEFNYITVDVPNWINFTIILLSFVTCAGLLYWSYEEDW